MAENENEITAINVKMTKGQKKEIIRKAKEEFGSDNVSEYMRTTALKANIKITVKK